MIGPSRRDHGARRWARATRVVLSIALALFIIGGLFSGYVFYSTVRALVAETDLPVLPNLNIFAPDPPPAATGDVPEVPVWHREERLNILLLGVDKRPDENIFRTDTMMVLTLDPETGSAALLSIPRDLWVPIPTYGEARINQAYMEGELHDYPGGGPALAMRTVQEFLGVPIHRYVLVDFNGFKRLIDTLGGIDINVEKAIDDTVYPTDDYGYTEVHIPAGLIHMDGDLALKYARVRHGTDDIDRAKRQQKVLIAARDKSLSLNLLPKLPTFMATLLDTVQTDLQPAEILTLAKMASQIESDKIQNYVIDYSIAPPTQTPTGASVLVPNRDKVRALVNEVFDLPSPENGELVKEEAATVEVLNGAGAPGLAAQMAAFLQEQGFNVVNIDNADRSDYDKTVIVDYIGKPNTVALLSQLLNVPSDEVLMEIGQQPGSAVIRIIVGKDFSLPTPEPKQ
jgi:LCP family protein required for cell wall assembly